LISVSPAHQRTAMTCSLSRELARSELCKHVA
jgi:hypothetical protein